MDVRAAIREGLQEVAEEREEAPPGGRHAPCMDPSRIGEAAERECSCAPPLEA